MSDPDDLDKPGDDSRLRLVHIGLLAVFTLGIGLGSSTRLTYHEAFVAQGAREMIRRGDWLVPTLGGRPWLEKPPLAHWLVALVSLPFGDVTETSARVPSALAALALACVVGRLVARRWGQAIGSLAGLIQVSTYWTVARGRLAESDILLAAIVAAALASFDALRLSNGKSRQARLIFFGCLGLSALVKGIGFGAALILAIVAVVLILDRDRSTFRALLFDPIGQATAVLLALAWPALVASRHPEAVGLWTLHIADRLADRPEHFASGPWWTYPVAALTLTLPWTPIALPSLVRSIRRSWVESNGLDRLLVAWAFVPLLLLSTATVKNAHYAIHALAPWSAWGAVGVAKAVGRLAERRGMGRERMIQVAWVGFGLVGIIYASTFGLVLPKLDDRSAECLFYRAVTRSIESSDSLVLLLDDWDRLPYATPFGPVPHDLALRLFYLDRPAVVRLKPESLVANPPAGASFAVIARKRDLATLQAIGDVQTLVEGPVKRWDRAFLLYRVTKSPTLDDVVR